MSAPRHSWSGPFREQHATKRVCCDCELMKVTRHEPGERPRTEFWRRGERVRRVVEGRDLTPPCEGVGQ